MVNGKKGVGVCSSGDVSEIDYLRSCDFGQDSIMINYD